MDRILRLLFFILGTFLIPQVSQGQIQSFWIDTTTHGPHQKSFFFTNRPYTTEDGAVTFKNKSARQTDNLFFFLFDYKEDSLYLKYRAWNPSGAYPVEKVDNNFLYKVYEDIRMKRGIKAFSFIIPGFAHTFEKQVYQYMQDVKDKYADTLSGEAALILYAWAAEWRAYRYLRGRNSAKRAAHDFAIFQHMLEDFLSDSAYFASHPKDFEIYLTCTSMGNQLLKEYLLERERQGIPLKIVYDHIYFIGSDAGWHSFEPGKGFHNIGQFCDSVSVVWHDKDIPLRISETMNVRKRMGNHGPRNPEQLPGFIQVYNIEDWLREEDRSGLWHNYLLTNPVVREALLDE